MSTTPHSNALRAGDQKGRLARKTFEDAMSQMVTRSTRRYTSPGKAAITHGVLGPAIAITVGAGGRLLLAPSTSRAVTESVIAVAVMVALLAFTSTGAIGPVDWATATPYWHSAGTSVRPRNRALIDRVITHTLHQYQRITDIHVYVHPCPHRASGDCGTSACNDVGVLAVGRRRVVYLGACATYLPAPELEVVLRHEMRHTTGIMQPLTLIIGSTRIIGWLGLGYVVGGWSLIPAIVGFYALLAGLLWVLELACDHAAMTVAGRSAAVAAFEVARRVQRVNAAALSRRVRAGWWLYRVLVPSHPPLWVRAAFARGLARRAS